MKIDGIVDTVYTHTGNLKNGRQEGITLIALVITILFSYDEK